jgi:hypothetical protein
MGFLQREVKKMHNRATAVFAVAMLVCLVPAACLALTPYSQDFEGLVQPDVGALAADGWLVFGNVFGLDWAYWYGYGPFPAPNDGAAFCAIAVGEGGPGQGAQQLSVYSDYNNTDHPIAWIESNVFQEQIIGPGDVSEMWVFDFQAKRGNLAGSTTALAFIKTLDPNAGYATTNFITVDMTSIPTTWGGYSLSIVIDPSLDGQILQFGFASTATNYEPSAIIYDNLWWHTMGGIPVDDMSWGGVKSLYR